MLKIVSPGAQDFGGPQTQLIKVSSRGLRGNDFSDFVKVAGHYLANEVARINWAQGEVGTLLNAVGATEYFGPNRNFDGFREEPCRAFHQTFKKLARFYRDHCNRDPAKSYGIIKLSAYNELMHRIDLVCALNGTDECAKRNGGLVADKELEKLAKNENLGVSMACKVAFDTCSMCGHHARNRTEYCLGEDEGGHCKAGGLKNRIGRILADGHILHADNPEPLFFDISHVYRPADRIAYANGLLKAAAADGKVITGTELAAAVGLQIPLLARLEGATRGEVAQQLKAAYALVACEQAGTYQHAKFAAAAVLEQSAPLPELKPEQLGAALRSLLEEKIALPLRDFIMLMGHAPVKTAAEVAALVTRRMPGVYERLIADLDLETKLAANPYAVGPAASIAFRQWAHKSAEALSLRPLTVTRRSQQAVIRNVKMASFLGENEKLAATPALDELAEHYALYNIAFLAALGDEQTDWQPIIENLTARSYLT
jgi:hypothetical protein